MNVKVKRLNGEAVIPQYAKPGDSGFDLVATEDVIIAPGEAALVSTGLAFEIPEGFELQVRPRSGVSLRTKLRVANTPGTIDSSYRGEVKVIIDNIAHLDFEIDRVNSTEPYELWPVMQNAYHTIDGSGDSPQGNVLTEETVPVWTYIIRKGDRIAQGVIAPVIRANLIETDGELTETERGDGGFGSTGVSTEEAAENVRKAFEIIRNRQASDSDYIEMEIDDEEDE